MNRREIIRSMGLISAHALFPSILSGFITSCTDSSSKGEQTTRDYSPLFFSAKEYDVIKQIVDLIIPATKTASASQVGAHRFIDEVFAKCLSVHQQTLINEGLTMFIDDFTSSDNKEKLLTELDEKAYGGIEECAWFKPLKQYTLIGFFTSQEGTTKASNYVPVPGDYKGDIPLEESTLNYGFTKQRYYL